MLVKFLLSEFDDFFLFYVQVTTSVKIGTLDMYAFGVLIDLIV